MAQDVAPAVQQAPEAAPAAQQPSAPANDVPEEDQIVVIADRIPGQVQTDSPPVLELNEEEVAAYGASSIADLVAQLAPQTGSGRGRGGQPVFLVNGQRVSGFREFSRYPPEAIRKVEVLPEEVALKFGFPADARVINFILKPDFASREIEGEFGMPTAGGYTTQQVEASLLKIMDARRINAGIDYQRSSPLTEAERGVVQTLAPAAAVVAAGLDPADFRTLTARRESVTANATLTQGLGELGSGGQLTINGETSRSVTRSLSGIDPTDLTEIGRRTSVDTYSLGGGYNRQLGDWRFSTTLDANRTDSDSRRDVAAGTGFDRSLGRTWTADLKSTLAGSPFRLPGGEANLTLDTGYRYNRIESSDTRSQADIALDRNRLRGGANLSLPITSRREGFLDAIGDLSVTIGGGVDRLSDFGTLTDWNLGANWRPTDRLSLQASYIAREVAPTLSQLGNPQIVDVNVPVYDFARGQTVFATVVSGGNPNLLAEKQRDLKLSAAYEFDLLDRADFRVEYFRNRSDNTTESFPLLTPAIEAAFPGHVTRAADGTLLSVDQRPVTFSERRSSRIRYGFNIFGKVGKPKPQGEGTSQRSGFGALMAAAQPAAPTAATPAPQASGAGASGQSGGFDSARFEAMRTKFCGTPEGQVPDLTGVPERMLERMKGADGQIDPAKVAEARTRICSAEGGPRRTPMTREAFIALRTALTCDDLTRPIDTATIPPQVLERMKKPDGTIDEARLAEFRQRICAMPVPEPGAAVPGMGRRSGDSGSAPRGAGGPDGPRGAGPGGPGRGGPGGGGGRGGFMGGGGGDGQGRWNLSLYHTIELDNRALVAPGGPALDLLSGDALGDGGISRHRIELEGGVFKDGIGVRLSGNYRAGTTVRGSGLPGSSDLKFGDLATFDLRTFVNLEQQEWLTGKDGPGFWKGTRLSLRVNNLFDTRQKVTDGTGTVPLRYQPGLIDPTGRLFEIEFRKMF